MRTFLTTTVLLLFTAAGLAAQEMAEATLTNPEGEEVGRATLTETPGHGVLIHLEVWGLEPGPHGFHIHETGRCEPDFGAAGGHYAPRGHSHGALHPDGKHAGDLLNLYVPESGALTVDQLAEGVTLQRGVEGTLFDDDGSALLIHTGPDDYRSQPTGDAGGRAACGVIR